jgi:hypothetical protein
VNLRFWKKQEIYGTTISEAAGSSQVSDNSLYYQYVRPEVDFKTCYEYYRTIGRVQNAVESYVSQVLSRDWYFEGPQEAVRQLEEWEDRFNLSRLLEYMVRDWLVCGNSILGVSDWQPVQVSSIIGMKRNQYGMPEQFVQQVNGREVALDASKFVHTQYIELNREAWGVGMFHSLLTTFDYGSKKRSLPQLEIYRRQIQLFYKVLERYGSPVTVWFFDNVSKAEFDKQVEELRALEAGDRRILSKKVEIATETIDGRGNLINATSPFINQEIEAGLQTSANRLITQPSAMADARSAGEKDDVRSLLIAEKIRRVMNVLIIPKLASSRVEFKWGKQDSFEFDFGQLLQAKSAGFVSAQEGRAILQSVGWKLDDGLFNQQSQQLQKQEGFRFLEEAPSQLLTEHNDCHDSSGRFCSGSGGGSKSPSGTTRSKGFKVKRANRDSEEHRRIVISNKIESATTPNGQKSQLIDKPEVKEALKKGLEPIPADVLEKHDLRVVDSDVVISPEDGMPAQGFFIPTEVDGNKFFVKNTVNRWNAANSTVYSPGDIVIAIDNDPKAIERVTIHESTHLLRDLKVSDPTILRADEEYANNYVKAMINPETEKLFEDHFRKYGTPSYDVSRTAKENAEEGYAVIAEKFHLEGEKSLTDLAEKVSSLAEIIKSWMTSYKGRANIE